MPQRLAIDIGGTFTDAVLMDEQSGTLRQDKVLSTPSDPYVGTLDAIEKVGVELGELAFFVHGTTVGINALLERKGVETGLITTKGFRDVYEIGRHNREQMYDLFYKKPAPLVPRRNRLEVVERVGPNGEVIRKLDEGSVIEAAKKFKERGIKSIAVCLLHSYANPEHELLVKELINKVYREATISLSHQIVQEWREYERTSTTVLNAYIAPVIERYLERLIKGFKEEGFRSTPYIMQSNGGIMTAEAASGRAIQTIFSGPAGGVIGSARVGELLGYRNVIAVDMGGTSFDLSLVIDGRPDVTAEMRFERYPVLTPMIDIESAGAGGGSIAWISEGKGLRVGPQSAGADPGPACYGRGGTEPTVTDANVVLGRVNPDYFLGGEMKLNPDAAWETIDEEIARPLRLEPTEAAAGILRVVNAKMAYAIRERTVKRGVDPRDFAMIAFGGAGPMHAVFLAQELGIKTTIVPKAPGAFSALGMLHTDIRHDVVQTYRKTEPEVGPAELEKAFRGLELKGREMLKAEGVKQAEMVFLRSADMRYVGQEYTVNIPVSNVIDNEEKQAIKPRFDDQHYSQYGHRSPEEPAEFVNLRVAAIGKVKRPRLEESDKGEASAQQAIKGVRKVFFDVEFMDTKIYERELLLGGNAIRGPAIVEEKASTTVLPPRVSLVVDRFGNLLVTLEE